jgi:hypothetical protein
MEKLLEMFKAEMTMRKIPEPMIDLVVNLVAGVADGIRDLVESTVEANRAATLMHYAQAAVLFNDLEFTTDLAAECLESAREISGAQKAEDGPAAEPPASA